MLTWRQQFVGENTCVLASFCQLHPELDYNKLKKTWPAISPGCDALRAAFLAELGAPANLLSHLSVTLGSNKHLSIPQGRGLLFYTVFFTDADAAGSPMRLMYVMVKKPFMCHAVSYENGKLLDPQGPGTMETWEEHCQRLRDENHCEFHVCVEEIIPL